MFYYYFFIFRLTRRETLIQTSVRHLQLKEMSQNISSATSSQQISGNNHRVIKIAMKSFSKICRSKSTLNCRSHHLCIKINAHNRSNVRNYDVILTKGLQWPIMHKYAIIFLCAKKCLWGEYHLQLSAYIGHEHQ